jgi:transcriptional regulator with PAS, ATPase and Fis domain
MAKGKCAGGEVSLEEEVETLKKHMGLIMRTVKDLKGTVEALGKKTVPNENDEVKEIMETQRVIEEVLVANSDAMKRIDKEIVKIMNTKEVSLPVVDANKDNLESVTKANNVNKMTKKCRYFNRGFCKYREKCRFYHPEHICEAYLKSNNCEQKECCKRHPKRCTWEGN